MKASWPRGAIKMNTRIIPLTVPRRRIFVKLGWTILNTGLKIIRKKFKLYVHNQEKIDKILSESGYRRRKTKKYRAWQTSILKKTKKYLALISKILSIEYYYQ